MSTKIDNPVNIPWTRKWPQKEGHYWFWGWPFGRKNTKAAYYLIKVGFDADKNPLYIGDGHFWYPQEKHDGMFSPAFFPSPPEDMQLQEPIAEQLTVRQLKLASDALLAECLVFIEELGHGPACDTWSSRRDAKCDCDIPRLIRRVKKQLKANNAICVKDNEQVEFSERSEASER
jgi:hypothetical protein